ncbi:MAG: VPLPA-CTERM sorting domain-containing protein [Pseudomonadota bacterium]
MKNIIAAGSLAIAASFAAPAFAVTEIVADGGTVCESLDRIDDSAGTPVCSITFEDFPNGSPDDELTFEGSGTILGFLADNTGAGPNYSDFVTVKLDKASDINFSLFGSDNDIDVSFFFGPAESPGTTVNANGSTSLFATAGTYIFGVDATSPTDSGDRLETSYSLNITAVPLPASGLMLLAGLGAIGVARRRRKKA